MALDFSLVMLLRSPTHTHSGEMKFVVETRLGVPVSFLVTFPCRMNRHLGGTNTATSVLNALLLRFDLAGPFNPT